MITDGMIFSPSREQRVKAFREAADKKTILEEVDESVIRCLQEEIDEMWEAVFEYLNSPNTIAFRQNMVKELADVQYTLSQLALYLNVNLEEAFTRVHESNITKVVNGKIILREDGKILKPATYQAPDMNGL
jgi:NTP pyrophosphatase (non-canonical NTP hydrolase)